MKSSTARPPTRTLNSDGKFNTSHDRFGSRSLSSFDTNSSNARIRFTAQPHCSATDSTKEKSNQNQEVGSVSLSPSRSKFRRRRKNIGAREGWNVYDRAFKVVFFVCLFLFFHALSGVGVRVPPEELRDNDQKLSSDEAQVPRLSRHHPRVIGHDHLAIDVDGHYTYTAALADVWRWGQKQMNYTSTVSIAGDTVVMADDTQDFPRATYTQTAICIGTDATPTPPPAATSADVFTSSISHAPTDKHKGPVNENTVFYADEDDDMDLPLFGLDDPVYPLRIHLPASMSLGVPEEHRRGRWGRKHGRVML